jgi:predicted outer membrane repeat protein
LSSGSSSLIEDTCFAVCCAEEFGGAIRINVDTSISNSFFDRCKAVGCGWTEGGGIYVKGTSMSISGCTFAGCTSSIGGGGAISFSGDGTLRIEDTSFLSCICYGVFGQNGANDSSVGGAIHIYGKGIYCRNCSFMNGVSNLHGGGIGESEDTITKDDIIELEGCVFTSNRAGAAGGGVASKKISIKCTNCMFFHNNANDGSAIAGDPTYNYILIRCVFLENIANCNAAIFGLAGPSAALSITDVIFLKNKASCGMFFIFLYTYLFYFWFFIF